MKKLFSCKSKIFGVIMTCVVLISTISTTAFADTASPTYKTPKISGHEYSFTSEVWTRYVPNVGYTVEAVAPIKADVNVPTGYMGGQARLYNSSGSLKASSSWTYNPSSTSAFFVYSSRISTAGQYYAYNQAEFYNGSGYTRYTGYQSPIQTLSSSKSVSTTETLEVINDLMLKTEYSVNDKGEPMALHYLNIQ